MDDEASKARLVGLDRAGTDDFIDVRADARRSVGGRFLIVPGDGGYRVYQRLPPIFESLIDAERWAIRNGDE